MNENNVMIYQDENGITKVTVRFSDEDLWLTQSQIATRFRRWATIRLHEYIQKGFSMDDDRLKQGGSRYFRELLQRIRDIRSSERNFYQQVTDIYATATESVHYGKDI